MALRNRELHAKNDDDECLLAVWLAGNTLFLINVLTKVTNRLGERPSDMGVSCELSGHLLSDE